MRNLSKFFFCLVSVVSLCLCFGVYRSTSVVSLFGSVVVPFVTFNPPTLSEQTKCSIDRIVDSNNPVPVYKKRSACVKTGVFLTTIRLELLTCDTCCVGHVDDLWKNISAFFPEKPQFLAVGNLLKLSAATSRCKIPVDLVLF